ncbi:MAG: hypothetical protein JSW52_11340 [Candidatus Coatesbacteria bacterium]|nr:MAG: hypothetical protein JSW52_11340 [Candidatus Coatesbacteria bacterium]
MTTYRLINVLILATVITVNATLFGCSWFEDCPVNHCGIGGGENGEPTETSTVSDDNPAESDPIHYTDAPPEGELARALLLLEGSEYPFHAVRAKPLPEFEELDGLQGWNAYAADDYEICIYVMLFNNQAEGLAAMEVLRAAADETAVYRNFGVNGALLYFAEADAEPSEEDE